MNRITIDCSKIASREDFHNIFAEALSFPGWYGRNLDALHDCLTDIHENTALVLSHWDTAELQLGAYAQPAKKAISAASRENPNLIVIFE